MNGVCRLELLRHHNELRLREEQRLRGRWNRGLREWTGCDGALRPGIAEENRTRGRRLRVGHSGSKGRVLLVALAGEEGGVIKHESAASANDSFAIPVGIKRDSDVGRELPPGVIRELPGDARVAVVKGTCGRVRINRAGFIGNEVGLAEHYAAIEVIVRHDIGPVAQTADQGQTRRGVKRVLNIEAGDRPAQCVLLLFALLERARRAECSHQKIEILVADGVTTLGAAAAVLAVECENTVALVGVPDIELVLYPFAAERNLVFALDPGDVVIDGAGIVVEVRNRVRSAADGEFAFGHLQSVGNRLIDIRRRVRQR